MKRAVAAYLLEERGAQDLYDLPGWRRSEWLTVAFHLFIGAPTQEAPLLLYSG